MARSQTVAHLTLADSMTFSGFATNLSGGAVHGEVVFTTGMTGYEQTLTDPSYAGQIVAFTYPLIGNYGVGNRTTWESDQVHAAGVIVSEYYDETDARYGRFAEWLARFDVPLMSGIDTRALTKHLRQAGTLAGALSTRPTTPDALRQRFVTCVRPQWYERGRGKTVLLIDCGTKDSIIQSLLDQGVTIRRVPMGYDITQETYDGVLISNGPGDPSEYVGVIEQIQQLIQGNKPIFGICLGSQLLALAAGARTYKLPFGHRGQNQPCIAVDDKHCVITSQNHGYAVDESTLPRSWCVTYRNLNDQSVEGIEHMTKPFFAVQFHPEASPGPTDTADLFERFVSWL